VRWPPTLHHARQSCDHHRESGVDADEPELSFLPCRFVIFDREFPLEYLLGAGYSREQASRHATPELQDVNYLEEQEPLKALLQSNQDIALNIQRLQLRFSLAAIVSHLTRFWMHFSARHD
jgi:hypothetical protein